MEPIFRFFRRSFRGTARRPSRSARAVAAALLVLVGIGGGARPAWAIRDRTIVLRAAGSGALLGLGAGLVMWPIADDKNTIFAGAAVGAVLGAVYGYFMVQSRNERYREQEAYGYADPSAPVERRPSADWTPLASVRRVPAASGSIGARNAEREGAFRRASRSKSFPIPLEWSVVAFRF